MSLDDAGLRELAANRGCRLRKSRVRTPGRGDYGRYGLEDGKTGRKVLGFGARGLTATAEEIEDFLRANAAATWKSSLGGTPTRKAKKKDAKAGDPEPPLPPREEGSRPRTRKPKGEPPAGPELRLRPAKPGDSGAIATLVTSLGYETNEAEVRKRLKALSGDSGIIVAEQDGLVGCVTWHVTPVLHRPKPVGRLTLLVVAEAQRGQGVGEQLVRAAERALAERGCGLVEVTSNRKRIKAHAFYERLGYERTSYRFARNP